MKAAIRVLVIVCTAIMLSGCQGLFGHHHFATNSARVEMEQIDMSGYFAARVEAGRVYLLRNEPSRAVVAYRQASYDPAHAAAAFNGMAVAYARMGRSDIARQLFGQALAADPADERVARNLARLDEPFWALPVLREHEAADPIFDAAAASIFAAGQNAAARAGPPPSDGTRMIRLSSKEVHLTSAPASVAPQLGRRAPEAHVATRQHDVAHSSIMAHVRQHPIGQYLVRTRPGAVR